MLVHGFAKLKVKASYNFMKNISISTLNDRLIATKAAIPKHAPDTIRHININKDNLVDPKDELTLAIIT